MNVTHRQMSSVLLKTTDARRKRGKMSVLMGLRSSLCMTANKRLASSLVSSRSSTAIPSGRRQTARLALVLSGSAAAVYVSWTNMAECSPPAPAVETPIAVPVMEKYDGEAETNEDNGSTPASSPLAFSRELTQPTFRASPDP